MITYLSVRNFKLADLVEIEFAPGFTVLTGETGAGKSLIVDAIGLLLGNRAQPDTISTGAERAEIQAHIELPEEHPARNWLAEQELDAEGECVLRRVLSRKSSSRAFVNGGSIAVQQLRELGDLLVDVHGQHEHQHLLSREHQRAMLDSFAGITAEVEALGRRFTAVRQIRTRLEKLKNQGDADRDRAALLEFQIRELEALELIAGEDETLHDDFNRLAHAQELLQGVTSVLDELSEADESSMGERLAHARHVLESLARHDARLNAIGTRLESLIIEVSELAIDLRERVSDYEFDPAEFSRLQTRLDLLHGASRKYRVDISELPALLTDLKAELATIAADDEAIAAMEGEFKELRDAYDTLAATVGTARTRAAVEMSSAIEAQLRDLGMADARFEVRLEPQQEARAHGLESVEFAIATNKGQGPGPLTRVASGGELSRVALAINMISNQGSPALVQIYDEVDVGIGGRVAEMVGKKLRTLASHRQVLCVTHLPQVASQGQHHKRVAKAGEQTTAVAIENLDADARTAEIARMLGGIEITERTLEHAGEMLAKAST